MACLIKTTQENGSIKEKIIHNNFTSDHFTINTNRRRTKIHFTIQPESAELINDGIVEDYSHLTRFTLHPKISIGIFKIHSVSYEIWHLNNTQTETLTKYINSSQFHLTNPKSGIHKTLRVGFFFYNLTKIVR